MRRKEELVTGEIYHIYNRSIADFKIFNSTPDFLRMKNMLRYYQVEKMNLRFSQFIELYIVKEAGFINHFISLSKDKNKLVQIIAYCLMPSHLHLIVKQSIDNGITKFMGNLLNSYSRYFNIKYNRKGPLWEGKFKNIFVDDDQQLLHLTRYVHLNPVTGYLVNKPEEWAASSYNEYISKNNDNDGICKYDDILDIESAVYKKFVEDRISYQRDLAKIKNALLE